jgi:hypothetical protein
MKKIDFYVHIGAGKTGTSAIQAFLNNNRVILFKDHSCIYPNTNAIIKQYNIGKCRNHIGFFKNKSELEIITEIRNIIVFSRENNVQKIVFSWEGLFDRHQFARIIKSALAGSDDVSPWIILYLRRQDHWLESAWKQWFAMRKEYKDFHHFITTYKIGWDDALAVWSDNFGKDRILIQPYESSQLKGGLIDNFLEKLKIEYKGNHWNEVENQDYNLGFNEDIIEILYLNRDYYSNTDSSILQNYFANALPKEYKKSPFEKYSLISPRKRLEILNQYEPMNRYIARNFLMREDGRLFYEPWPSAEDHWNQSAGLTVEKMVPVFSYLLYTVNNRTKRPVLPTITKEMKTNIEYFIFRILKNKVFDCFKKV